MELLYPRCAALDVHKRSLLACRLLTPEQGPAQQETRSFGTMTAELLTLLDWLLAAGVTHVAMESTGEYWKPVYNLLEGHVEILLVNARHVHQVPGRKTDVLDAEWLADLLRHGLLKPSFVPPKPQRQLRALTRQRSNLVAERAMVVNWLQKVLEDANLKLASVVTDVTGVSARAMLQEITQGQTDPATLAELGRTHLRRKRELLEAALAGRVEAHHRFLLTQHLTHLAFLEEQIERFNEQIALHLEQMSAPAPPEAPPEDPASPADATPPPAARRCRSEPPPPGSYRQAVALLDAIPGIDRKVAEAILAEIGVDMGRFPSVRHLCSWAGVAPGNRESAGKQRSGRTRDGNAALKKALVQAAHGAIRKKDCYFGSQYRRLSGRRGKRRALVAVAHALLVVIYHVLLWQEPYQELGANYFDERKRESVVQRLVRRLEKLGHTVTLALNPAAAAA